MTKQPPVATEFEPDSPEEDDLADLDVEDEDEIDPLDDDDLDGSLEPPAPVDVESVQEETRKSTTLAGRLKGVKHRSRKVLLFLDADAANALAHTNAMLQRVTDAIGELGPVPAGASEDEATVHIARRDALIEQQTALERTLEPVRAQALENALAVYMVGYPAIAVQVARRAAIRIFRDPATKKIDAANVEEFSEFIEDFLMGSSIVKVVDNTGAQLDLPKRSEIASTLRESLPAPQWERLKTAFMQLNVEDQIAQVIQDDPGF